MHGITAPPFDPGDPVFQFIEHFEGLRLKAYRCPAGVWTIGIGHTGGVKPNQTITLGEATLMLVHDVDRVEADVLAVLDRAPTRNQLRAMTSLAFNIGGPAFQTSTLHRFFNAGRDQTAITAAFRMWCMARLEGLLVTVQSLTERRLDEAALFARPDDQPMVIAAAAPVSGSMPQSVLA